MKFDWRNFTEENYKDMLAAKSDYLGAVYVGDICIELIAEAIGTFIHENYNVVEVVEFNFYVAHEDTGYSCEDAIPPYDYADGFAIEMPYGLTYEEFKNKAEKSFVEYIEAYEGNYSLVDHANRQLEIW